MGKRSKFKFAVKNVGIPRIRLNHTVASLMMIKQIVSL